jgi:hypothetical protein
MSHRRSPEPPLPDPARRALWDQLWDRLLQPPRTEPATPEQVPTPESVADPEPRSRGEERR